MPLILCIHIIIISCTYIFSRYLYCLSMHARCKYGASKRACLNIIANFLSNRRYWHVSSAVYCLTPGGDSSLKKSASSNCDVPVFVDTVLLMAKQLFGWYGMFVCESFIRSGRIQRHLVEVSCIGHCANTAALVCIYALCSCSKNSHTYICTYFTWITHMYINS